MKDPDRFVTHVKEHTTTAMVSLQRALKLLEDPYPGLTTWMLALGTRLDEAKAAIERAQRMP